jgi:hypothetical protein
MLRGLASPAFSSNTCLLLSLTPCEQVGITVGVGWAITAYCEEDLEEETLQFLRVCGI